MAANDTRMHPVGWIVIGAILAIIGFMVLLSGTEANADLAVGVAAAVAGQAMSLTGTIALGIRVASNYAKYEIAEAQRAAGPKPEV